MELDELKQTLRALEQRVAQESRLTLAAQQEQKRLRAQAGLRPLYLLCAAEILFGIFLALLVGPFWVSHLDEPHLLIAGLAVHAYAIALIVLGARTLTALLSLDFGAPVLAIQEQLARTRRTYIRSGLIVGLPWWVLWMPFAMLFFETLGFDLYASFSRAWFASNVAVGIVGMIATLWFCRGLWYRPSDSTKLRQLEESWGGRSLLKVQRFLDELAEFAKE